MVIFFFRLKKNTFGKGKSFAEVSALVSCRFVAPTQFCLTPQKSCYFVFTVLCSNNITEQASKLKQ